jgi:hypothetical protein
VTDIEELRQTLVDHTVLAPDADGLVEAVQAGAVRIRRRRRVTISACAAIVAVLAVAAPLGISRLGFGTTSTTGTAAHRGPFQLAVELVPDGGYYPQSYGIAGRTQHITARSFTGDSTDGGGDVAVHDPGTFDARALLRGERVTVAGHSAYYVTDLPLGKGTGLIKPGEPVRGPAVGWRDASGAWVVVYDSRTKAGLLRLAAVVRLGTPRDIQTPFHLGYLPNGLHGSYAKVRDYEPADADALFGLDSGGLPPDTVNAHWTSAPDLPLTIQVLPRSTYLDSHTETLGPATKIAGYDTWYVTRRDAGYMIPAGGSALIVNVGHCQVDILVQDRGRIPFDELKRIVEGAQFADCTDPSTWTTPL